MNPDRKVQFTVVLFDELMSPNSRTRRLLVVPVYADKKDMIIFLQFTPYPCVLFTCVSTRPQLTPTNY